MNPIGVLTIVLKRVPAILSIRGCGDLPYCFPPSITVNFLRRSGGVSVGSAGASARCYGVARQREGSRQTASGGSGVLSLRHFRAGSYPLILGAWVPKNLARRRMVSAGAMLLDRLGPPGFRFNDFQAPRFAPLSPLRVREGATAAHQFPAPWLRLLTFIFCPDHTCPPLEASALALRRRRAGALHCGEFGIDAATVLSGRPS